MSLRAGSFIISDIEGGPPPDCIRSALFREGREEISDASREKARAEDRGNPKNVHVSNRGVLHKRVESSRSHHLREEGWKGKGREEKVSLSARVVVPITTFALEA